MLPEALSPRAKRMVAFSTIVGLALCALFVLGILIAGITDGYDQFWTIITAEILIVGVVTVASVLFTLVNQGK